ncbi:MAG: MATE family efflux transporter [Clostridia bacterium]|nr:MATE family efflux transporter [Clostridia bacterium]
MSRKNNEIDMTQGPIFKHMLVMSLAVMATGIFQQFFNTADLLIVGQFGEKGGIASVGACSSLINLMINLFIGLSAGSGIVIARHYGARNDKEASRCVHTAITLSFVAGIILAIVAWFASEPLLKLLDTPTEDGILAGAVTYMKIYFLGMPFVLLFNFCSSILRAVGDTKRTFSYIMQAGVINVILNLIFVIVFKLNVAGVALATIISQCYCAIRCILCFLRYDGILKLFPKKLRMYKSSLKDIAKLGIPSGIQSSLFSFSNVFIQSSINALGPAAVSGAAAAQNIEMYQFFPADGVNNALLSYTSQNYGARKPERIKKAAFIATGMILTSSISMGILIIAFSKLLLSFYNVVDPVEVSFGIERIMIVSSFQFLGGLMNMTATLLRGVFKPIPAMVFSIAGICIFRLLWISTVFVHHKTMTSLFLSYPISWFISFLAQGIMFIYVYNKYIKKMKNEQTISA